MVSGKNSKAARNARASVVTKRSTPWGTIVAVAVVVLFAVGVFGYAFVQNRANSDQDERSRRSRPPRRTRTLRRRSRASSARTTGRAARHARPAGRLHPQPAVRRGARRRTGRPATAWSTRPPVRNENLVHSLEHGAVWIAYNPDQVTGRRAGSAAGQGRGRVLHGDVALPGPRLAGLAAVVGPPAQGRRRQRRRGSTSSSRRCGSTSTLPRGRGELRRRLGPAAST